MISPTIQNIAQPSILPSELNTVVETQEHENLNLQSLLVVPVTPSIKPVNPSLKPNIPKVQPSSPSSNPVYPYTKPSNNIHNQSPLDGSSIPSSKNWNPFTKVSDDQTLQSPERWNSISNPFFNSAKTDDLQEMQQVFNTFSTPNIYRAEDQGDLKKEDSANDVSYEFDPEGGEEKQESKDKKDVKPLQKNGFDQDEYNRKYSKEKKRSKIRSDDFEPNLGKVIDTLNTDYPLLWFKPLDYSIYIKDIEVTDPTGIAFQGISVYKQLFTALRFFAKTIFSSQEITYKLHYDYMEQVVRIIWHVKITSEFPIFNSPLYVDGISKYHINWEGFVFRHEVSNIVVNGIPQEPPYVRFFDLSWVLDPQGQPVPGLPIPS